jgi:hypothetical protein
VVRVPASCAECDYVVALNFHRGRCEWRGGLGQGPIVELHKEPPRSCPLRAFSEGETKGLLWERRGREEQQPKVAKPKVDHRSLNRGAALR